MSIGERRTGDISKGKKGGVKIKNENEIFQKIVEIEMSIRRYEKKGDFYKSNMLKRDLAILKWVLQ